MSYHGSESDSCLEVWGLCVVVPHAVVHYEREVPGELAYRAVGHTVHLLLHCAQVHRFIHHHTVVHDLSIRQ